MNANLTEDERREAAEGRLHEHYPQCEGYVKGPTVQECPACHHKFTFKTRIVAKPVGNRGSELEEHVMLLALKLGSLDAVKKAFEKLKTDPPDQVHDPLRRRG